MKKDEGVTIALVGLLIAVIGGAFCYFLKDEDKLYIFIGVGLIATGIFTLLGGIHQYLREKNKNIQSKDDGYREKSTIDDNGVNYESVKINQTNNVKNQFCTECGAELNNENNFCGACGAKVKINL